MPGSPRTGLRPWGGDALYPVLANLPAILLQQRRDSTIAVTSILAGELHDGPGECIFIFALCQLIALRAAWLVHQQARPPFAHGLLLSIIDGAVQWI
jgi:hypothetical protein